MSDQRPAAAKFFDHALQYKNAADLLYESFTSPDYKQQIREPMYFLYHHAVELAFRSFLVLRSKRQLSQNHDIAGLYEECTKLGLGIKSDYPTLELQRLELNNLVNLLAGANENHFCRYPNGNKRIGSGPEWTKDVVGKLFDAVAPLAQSDVPAVTKRLYFGKPVFVPQPVPLKPGP